MAWAYSTLVILVDARNGFLGPPKNIAPANQFLFAGGATANNLFLKGMDQQIKIGTKISAETGFNQQLNMAKVRSAQRWSWWFDINYYAGVGWGWGLRIRISQLQTMLKLKLRQQLNGHLYCKIHILTMAYKRNCVYLLGKHLTWSSAQSHTMTRIFYTSRISERSTFPPTRKFTLKYFYYHQAHSIIYYIHIITIYITIFLWFRLYIQQWRLCSWLKSRN